MKTRKIAQLLSIGLCALPMFAYAGAGASVNACIYMPTAPSKPFTAKVTAGGSGTHCMNDTGHDTTIQISQAGLNCSSVGYVEAKASSTKGDTCATDSSTWPLGYSTNGLPYTGATQSSWSGAGTRNSIKLSGSSPGTVVCNSPSLCASQSANWDHGTQGPLYIIFQPLSGPQ
ncbi:MULTISPECIES: hypothetical protein [Burkholderia]|uniref:hypothetical protein n=1 Tax=Burkholderia TaxID=32008 RepID=UPI0018D378BF|nr:MULTISPECIES: hypothetical protein [Burkholderia]